jgi:ABC-type uncharacterized transport system substrate-binding protein
MPDIKRRSFITLLGRAAAAWPLAAGAQQPTMPVIGFLDSRSPDAVLERLRGFRQGLKDNGFVEGDNVTIVYRWAENQFDRLPDLAAELVRRQVAVIAVTGPPAATFAAKAATATIPIVFLAGQDPVRLGLVTSLARPDGNLTGVNFFNIELVAKQLELLLLINPANPTATESTVRDAELAARTMGLQIQLLRASAGREIDTAFTTFERERPDAIFVPADAFFASRRVQVVQLATHYPAMYPQRDFSEIGGLMSYGSNVVSSGRRLLRPHPQGCQGGGLAGGAIEQV